MSDTQTIEPPKDQSAEYLVLARKYRPQNFEELKGQEALVQTLTNAIESGRIAHAFMLTGVRGVGKTTTARIIARALNCLGEDGKSGPTTQPCGVCENCKAISEDRHVDVLEMDAASRTGVDDIREIINSVQYAPSSARYKVYIIDEVHMLSKNAFNALLKTLEEPPEHVKFIFATTEIRKVPVTVLSRCQRFDLRRIDADVLERYFAELVEKESYKADAEAISLIARAADGSCRDGLSLLDQALSLSDGTVTEEKIRDMLGLADRAIVLDLYEAVMQGENVKALAVLENLYKAGADPLIVLKDLLEWTHFLTKTRAAPETANDMNLPEAERVRGKELAEKLSIPSLTRSWQILLKGIAEVQQSPLPQQAVEMVIIRLLYAAELPNPADLIKQLQNGTLAATAPAPRPSGNSGGASAGTMSATTTGGGGVPQQAVAQPVTQPDSTPAAPQPTSFLDVVELFGEMREPLLQAQIKNYVHLVKFDQGKIELRLAENANPALPGRMTKLLSDWTEKRWMVSVSDDVGQPTLAEQGKAIHDADLEQIKQHPVVAEILNCFDGAEIIDIREKLLQEDKKT